MPRTEEVGFCLQEEEKEEVHGTPHTWQGFLGPLFAVTATAGSGAFPAQKELNKTHPKIIPHAEGNHRESLSAAQRIYFNILAFDINKTKAVQDSLFCLLSNEHQHDNYIKIDWFKNVYSN